MTWLPANLIIKEVLFLDTLSDVDDKLIRHVINRVVPFKTVLAQAGIEISGSESN